MRRSASGRPSRPEAPVSDAGAGRSVDLVVGRARRVLAHAPAALITDIDGTISRIAPRPEDAVVSETASAALRRIALHLRLTAVVTGREASVARAMVGVEGLTYVGNYAVDGTAAPATAAVDLTRARQEVLAGLGSLPCVEVEDKGISFALHYRGCDDRAGTRGVLLRLAAPIAERTGARIVEGKQVVEVVPASLPDKGTAVGRLLDQHGIEGAVYFGDDAGDVAAFRELARRRRQKGLEVLSVAVVDNETDDLVRKGADLTLDGVGEMEAVLVALAAELAGGGD